MSTRMFISDRRSLASRIRRRLVALVHAPLCLALNLAVTLGACSTDETAPEPEAIEFTEGDLHAKAPQSLAALTTQLTRPVTPQGLHPVEMPPLVLEATPRLR